MAGVFGEYAEEAGYLLIEHRNRVLWSLAVVGVAPLVVWTLARSSFSAAVRALWDHYPLLLVMFLCLLVVGIGVLLLVRLRDDDTDYGNDRRSMIRIGTAITVLLVVGFTNLWATYLSPPPRYGEFSLDACVKHLEDSDRYAIIDNKVQGVYGQDRDITIGGRAINGIKRFRVQTLADGSKIMYDIGDPSKHLTTLPGCS